MKRIGYLLLVAALGSPGCCLPDSFFEANEKPPRVELSVPPPAVTPDTVDEKNAAERAEALRQELEYELQSRQTVSHTKPESR